MPDVADRSESPFDYLTSSTVDSTSSLDFMSASSSVSSSDSQLGGRFDSVSSEVGCTIFPLLPAEKNVSRSAAYEERLLRASLARAMASPIGHIREASAVLPQKKKLRPYVRSHAQSVSDIWYGMPSVRTVQQGTDILCLCSPKLPPLSETDEERRLSLLRQTASSSDSDHDDRTEEDAVRA